MGCAGSKASGSSSASKPSSPDAAPKNRFGRIEGLKAEDFTCSNEEGTSFVKHSGQIMGQQFIVESCESSSIFLLDHIASVTLDNCHSCFIITGPVSSSLFMRDCRDCTLITVCQQIRLRNCANIKLLVCSTTGPIIESSTGIGFGCYNYDYTDLPKHFEEAKLSGWNNYWYDVYDFTPAVGNFYFLPVEFDPYTQLRASIEDREILELVPEDLMLVKAPGVDRPPFVLQTRGMVFQSLSQMNNLLIIATDASEDMLRKLLYEWINQYGKSFYTLNIKRLESLKRDDAGLGSFESLDPEDVAVRGVTSEDSQALEEGDNPPPTEHRRGYDHLSSTVATYNSSTDDLDKDPNIVVRTMRRALKKKNLDSFWGSIKKAKSVGLNENDVVTIVQVYGPDAANLKRMIEGAVARMAHVAGKKGAKGQSKILLYEGAEAIEKIPVVFEQWKDALF